MRSSRMRNPTIGIQSLIIAAALSTAAVPTPAAAEELIDKTITSTAEVEGMRFELSFAQKPIKAGQSVRAHLRITNSDGTPSTQLDLNSKSILRSLGSFFFLPRCKLAAFPVRADWTGNRALS
jgi:hypothetical protein